MTTDTVETLCIDTVGSDAFEDSSLGFDTDSEHGGKKGRRNWTLITGCKVHIMAVRKKRAGKVDEGRQ